MPAELIARARAGDGEAFRALTEPHRRELQVHCYRMLGSLQDAEDALQDTLLSAWQGLGGFEGRASIRTWLYRIATNRCLDALRSARRRPAKEWDIPGVDPPEPTAARRGRVARALSRRPPRGRDRCAARPRGPLRADRIHLPGLRDRAPAPSASPARRARLARRPRIPRERGGRHARLDRRVGHQRPQAGACRPAAPALAGRRARRCSHARLRRPSRRSWPSSSAPTSPPISTRCVALLTDDVFMSMPPMPLEYEGREVVARFLRRHPPPRPQIRPRPDASQRSTRVRHLPARPQRYPPRDRPVRPHPHRRPDLRHDPLREQRVPVVRAPTLAPEPVAPLRDASARHAAALAQIRRSGQCMGRGEFSDESVTTSSSPAFGILSTQKEQRWRLSTRA